MRRANKIALTMGSAALIVAGAVTAAPPVPYDQWQATKLSNGTTEIQNSAGTPLADPSTCPTNFTCGAGIIGDGFMQRTLTDSTGTQFFQTIITDKGVAGQPNTLGFSDESYVRSGGSSNGIAGRQRVTDLGITQPGTNLVTSNELNLGWASSVGTPAIALSQSVTQADLGFSTSFGLTDMPVAPGAPTGSGTNGELRTIALDQSILLSPGTQGSTDKQVFALRQTDAAAAGNLTVGTQAPIPFAAGEAIKAIWIGQNMPSTGGQVFGFEGYSNVNQGDVPVSFFTLAAPVEPRFWDTALFGTAPSFQ